LEGVVLNGNRVIAIRARARRGWSIKKIARVFSVSRNTVRRYMRPGATACRSPAKPIFDVRQELDVVRRIAWRWDRRDPDELESELTDKLAEIYPQKAVVAHWKTFLRRTLERAAINWLRARKRRERYVASAARPFPLGGEYDTSAVELTAVFDLNPDAVLPTKRMRRALPSFLRRVWDALIAEDFDQTRAARRLGVHRNTVHKAIRQIRRVLMRRGF
jgi:DNA-directed RNA polymerase specialized sigma24 family protein